MKRKRIRGVDDLSLYASGKKERTPVTQSGSDHALVPPTPDVSLPYSSNEVALVPLRQ